MHGHDQEFIDFQFQPATLGIVRDGYRLPGERRCAGRRDEIVQRVYDRINKHFSDLAGEWRGGRQRCCGYD